MHDRNEPNSRSPESLQTDEQNHVPSIRGAWKRTFEAIVAHLNKLGRAARIEMEKPHALRKKIYTRTLREKTGINLRAWGVLRHVVEGDRFAVERSETIRRGWGFERKYKRAHAHNAYKAVRAVARAEAAEERLKKESEHPLPITSRVRTVRVQPKTRTNDYFERTGRPRPININPPATVRFQGKEYIATKTAK
jgi:hypothetical protein